MHTFMSYCNTSCHPIVQASAQHASIISYTCYAKFATTKSGCEKFSGGVHGLSCRVCIFTVGSPGGLLPLQINPSPTPTPNQCMSATAKHASPPQEAAVAAPSPASTLLARKTEPTEADVELYLRKRGMGSFHVQPEVAAWQTAVSRAMRPGLQGQSSADLYVSACVTGNKERTARYMPCIQSFTYPHATSTVSY